MPEGEGSGQARGRTRGGVGARQDRSGWDRRWGGQGRGGARGGAHQGRGLQPALLTFALAILEGIAGLTGESLVAAEGTHRVHAVLAPAAGVQVRHTLVDVCRESGTVKGCRVVPGPQLAEPALPSRTQGAHHPESHTRLMSTCLCSHSFNKDLSSIFCANKHCSWNQSVSDGEQDRQIPARGPTDK